VRKARRDDFSTNYAALSPSSSSKFLFGFREGLKSGVTQLLECGSEKITAVARMSFPSNTRDRIGRALMFVTAQATGMKPAALADVLADLRKEAVELSKQ
jgi:hypothetical protein